MTRRCTSCKRVLPLEDFYRSPASKAGRDSRCKTCKCAAGKRYRDANRDKVAERKKRAYQANAQRHRDNALFKNYGITRAQYNQLLARQGGLCAICRKPERTRANNGRELRTLAVDHDHETGEIRGLLCAQCNKGIGNLGESSGRLSAAAAYLRDYSPHAPLLALVAASG